MTKVYVRYKQEKEGRPSNAPDQDLNRDGPLYENRRRLAARGTHWQAIFSRPMRFRGRFPLRYGAGQLYAKTVLACYNVIP